MMRSVLTLILGIALLQSGVADAHHDIADDMNLSSPIQLVGQIAAINWGEPHSSLQLNLPRAGLQDQEWLIQIASISELAEVEFSASDIDVGDWVAIILFVAESSDCSVRCVGYGLSLTDENDNSYTLSQQVYNLFVESSGREA